MGIRPSREEPLETFFCSTRNTLRRRCIGSQSQLPERDNRIGALRGHAYVANQLSSESWQMALCVPTYFVRTLRNTYCKFCQYIRY